jgi:transcriptional regulator with XRE-family HTH domain
MVIDLKSHPAVQFGMWLRTTRQAKGIVKRVFASQIFLTPSQYSEVEAGVVRWIQPAQKYAITMTFELEGQELKKFYGLLKKAREAVQLTFANIFTPEQLEPVRLRSDDHTYRPSPQDKGIILRAVFTPIV